MKMRNFIKNPADMFQEKLPNQNQLNVFIPVLKQLIDPGHALCALADQIDWLELETKFSKL